MTQAASRRLNAPGREHNGRIVGHIVVVEGDEPGPGERGLEVSPQKSLRRSSSETHPWMTIHMKGLFLLLSMRSLLTPT